METIKRAIEIDAGVSVLPEASVRREIALGSLAKVPLNGQPLTRPLGIVHRRDRQLSELAQQFVSLLKADGEVPQETSHSNGAPQMVRPAQSA